MARELPIELLALIASSVALSRDEALNSRGELPLVSLVPFTTVSRLWQTLFEPHIYRRLHVYSKEVQGIEYLKGKLTCERLKEITSGPPYRVARRSWIRDLTYRAVVPHHLKDYTRAALEGYSPDNAFRRANDRAFSAAILGLFNVLSSWDHGSARSSRVSISLHIRLYGERKYLPEEQSEPNTEFEEMAWAHTFEYTDGATRSVFPYNAKFVSEYPTLSHVSCVSSVSFGRDWVTSDEENGVWAAAALHILQYCNNLKKASLDLDYYIRPDQVSALQHRREVVATNLHKVPKSVRTFKCNWGEEYGWKSNMNAPNVLLNPARDSLSISLRDLSLQLQELHLDHLRITPDLFWPSDAGLETKQDLFWPNMEVVNISMVPPVDPLGAWLLLPEDRNSSDLDILDMDENIWNDDLGGSYRNVLDLEAFHNLYIAAGRAARRMPRLRLFRLEHRAHENQLVELAPEKKKGKPTNSGSLNIDWVSLYGYQPSKEVCEAWGLRPDQLEHPHETIWTAKFDTWPPSVDEH